jgi:hypothetical protein
MTDSQSALRTVEVPRSAWTGRLDFDLFNGRGWRVATVEVVVRIDNVTLWWANRTIAVMDRELFGQWLVRPDRVFAIDDVVWSVQGPHTCITIDNGISYAIPRDAVEQLLGVI